MRASRQPINPVRPRSSTPEHDARADSDDGIETATDTPGPSRLKDLPPTSPVSPGKRKRTPSPGGGGGGGGGPSLTEEQERLKERREKRRKDSNVFRAKIPRTNATNTSSSNVQKLELPAPTVSMASQRLVNCMLVFFFTSSVLTPSDHSAQLENGPAK